MAQSDKHSLQVDISEDAIADALRAVEGDAAEEAPQENVVELEVEAANDAADAAEPSEADVQRQLLEEASERNQQLMQRLQETNELRLRALADLENYKKRAARELEETRKFGIEKILKELLPVLDNLDRALEVGASDLDSFKEGVEMNRRLFEETLSRFGVEVFSAKGQVFDPHVHEAVQQVESHEHPQNVVVQELVRGYFLNERLIRPALVVVSAGPGPESATGDASEEAGGPSAGAGEAGGTDERAGE